MRVVWDGFLDFADRYFDDWRDVAVIVRSNQLAVETGRICELINKAYEGDKNLPESGAIVDLAINALFQLIILMEMSGADYNLFSTAVSKKLALNVATLEQWVVGKTLEHFDYDGSLNVVVDVGAHIGSLSIATALQGAKHVFAVEPSYSNYQLLKKFIVFNGVEDVVTPIMVAVSNKSGVDILRGGGTPGQKSLVYDADKFSSPVEAVPTVTLEGLVSTILELTGSDVIDYLKIDVEGAEFKILFREECLKVFPQIKFLDIDVHSPTNLNFYSSHVIDDLIERGFVFALETASSDLVEFLVEHGFTLVKSDTIDGGRSGNFHFRNGGLEK